MASTAEFEQIKRGVQVLANTFQARLSGDTIIAWAAALEKHVSAKLWKALGDSLEGDTMPTLRQLVERSRPDNYRKPGDTSTPPPQTDAYRKKIDLEKVMSLLYVSYTQPANTWFLETFNAGTMERLFGGTLAESIAKAKTFYAEETVVRWMQERLRMADAEDRAKGIRV